MDEPQNLLFEDSGAATGGEPAAAAPGLESLEKSRPFVGEWNRLVSQTNWEKGRIICEWRERLHVEGLPATAYSDDAWSRMVGGVTSQHVGRLRRVYRRFGGEHEQFEGLYWSHFQSALEWDDAEMWLEGALQNNWSVSRMRNQRWETLGADPGLKPDARDVILAELDEDFEPLTVAADSDEARRSSGTEGSSGPRHEGPDFGDDNDGHGAGSPSSGKAADFADEESPTAVASVQPFADLAELPEDVAEAFDRFKIAIIRHRTDGWSEISRDDLLACLEGLRELACLPSAGDAPN